MTGVLILGIALIAYWSFHSEDTHDQAVASQQEQMKSSEQRAAEPQTSGVPPAVSEEAPAAPSTPEVAAEGAPVHRFAIAGATPQRSPASPPTSSSVQPVVAPFSMHAKGNMLVNGVISDDTVLAASGRTMPTSSTRPRKIWAAFAGIELRRVGHLVGSGSRSRN